MIFIHKKNICGILNRAYSNGSKLDISECARKWNYNVSMCPSNIFIWLTNLYVTQDHILNMSHKITVFEIYTIIMATISISIEICELKSIST